MNAERLYNYNIGIAVMTVLAGYVAVTFLSLASRQQFIEMVAWFGIVTLPLFWIGIGWIGPTACRKLSPELEDKFQLMKYEAAMRWRTYPELPPEPQPYAQDTVMLFQDTEDDMIRRATGTPLREYVRIARVIKGNRYRIRARELGADYGPAVQLFGLNPYCCQKKRKTYYFTEQGWKVVNYLADLSPSEYKNIRYSVVRTLTHTHTHGGEVV